MKLEYFGLSDKGIKLEHNEDYYLNYIPDEQELIDKKGKAFIVADGMGGHSHGEVASKMAVDIWIEEYYTSTETIKTAMINAIKEANKKLFKTEQSDMGTTLTAAVFVKNKCYISHVGDSRLYMLRGRRLQQITRDHSWVGESLEMGTITKEQAKEHPYRNVLTRSVGQEEEVEPDFSKIKLHKNDRFLLCTDGIHSVLEEVSLYEILKYNETQIVCHKLIERAKSNGSKDNLTCIVIQVVKKDSWLKRLKILESTTAQISHEIISVFYLGLSIKR